MAADDARRPEPYAEAIREHCVPHDMRALIGALWNTRAMDIYVWLAYRLPRVPARARPLHPATTDLKPIFGAGVQRSLQVPPAVQALPPRQRSRGTAPLGSGSSRRASASSTAPRPCPLTSGAPPPAERVAGGRRRLRLVHNRASRPPAEPCDFGRCGFSPGTKEPHRSC